VLDIADLKDLRPTSERVRETVFNWLAPAIDGSRCLDLFAGTGALGLEALSRGAGEVMFVEKSKPAVRALHKNVQSLAATDAIVHHSDAFAFLETYSGKPFDIVFLDPPFAADYVEELCRLLAKKEMLAAGGKVYIERDRQSPLPALPDSWNVKKQKTAGNVRFALVETDADSH
jgi:16S rRNA (guanine966-N2)-methyltransferase